MEFFTEGLILAFTGGSINTLVFIWGRKGEKEIDYFMAVFPGSL